MKYNKLTTIYQYYMGNVSRLGAPSLIYPVHHIYMMDILIPTTIYLSRKSGSTLSKCSVLSFSKKFALLTTSVLLSEIRWQQITQS